jgi:hypothetical protein
MEGSAAYTRSTHFTWHIKVRTSTALITWCDHDCAASSKRRMRSITEPLPLAGAARAAASAADCSVPSASACARCKHGDECSCQLPDTLARKPHIAGAAPSVGRTSSGTCLQVGLVCVVHALWGVHLPCGRRRPLGCRCCSGAAWEGPGRPHPHEAWLLRSPGGHWRRADRTLRPGTKHEHIARPLCDISSLRG